MAIATEDSEIFLGTSNELSQFRLEELEARLDAEEMERNRIESLSSSLEKESFEIEEKSLVAFGSATVERQPSAEARTQQQTSNQSINKDGSRGIWRLIRLGFELILVLIVGICFLNGTFTSRSFQSSFAQAAQQDARIGVIPTQLCCPDQPIQASCYVFEVFDVSDLTPCVPEQEDQAQMQDSEESEDQWQDQNADTENLQMGQQQDDVSTFQVILSSASGQVHHIAFAFVNIPLVHGCALRRFRF